MELKGDRSLNGDLEAETRKRRRRRHNRDIIVTR
jgi:hypothetical protein